MGALIETELKLRADDDRALDLLARADTLGPGRLGPARTVDEHDAYLDTDDGRLAAARWACRLRSRDGRRWISLKGPAEHAPGQPLHRRPELEGPAPGGPADQPEAWPPSPARDLVVQLAGNASLNERLVLHQRRTERAVSLDGIPLATLSLDRVEVLRGGRTVGEFRIVELELSARASLADVDATPVLDALLGRPGLEPEPDSKLERALEMLQPAAGASG